MYVGSNVDIQITSRENVDKMTENVEDFILPLLTTHEGAW
jgi:hypothetical protein